MVRALCPPPLLQSLKLPPRHSPPALLKRLCSVLTINNNKQRYCLPTRSDLNCRLFHAPFYSTVFHYCANACALYQSDQYTLPAAAHLLIENIRKSSSELRAQQSASHISFRYLIHLRRPSSSSSSTFVSIFTSSCINIYV